MAGVPAAEEVTWKALPPDVKGAILGKLDDEER